MERRAELRNLFLSKEATNIYDDIYKTESNAEKCIFTIVYWNAMHLCVSLTVLITNTPTAEEPKSTTITWKFHCRV
jgi:hypothetical protein